MSSCCAGIIASKRCTNLTSHDNEVFSGNKTGIYLHRSSDDAKVYSESNTAVLHSIYIYFDYSMYVVQVI